MPKLTNWKCDEGTILNSGFTLNPKSGFTHEFVESLLKKDKKQWTKEEKKQFKQATFGSNRYSIKGVILFLIVVYLLSQLVVYVAVSLFSLMLPSMHATDVSGSALTNPFGLNETGMVITSLLGFAIYFLAIMIFDKPFLNTDIRHLISGRKKFDWKMFWFVFVCVLAVMGIVSAISVGPNITFELTDIMTFLPMTLFLLVFIPIQTTTEELICRCLLSRAFYRNNFPKWPKCIIIVLVSGMLFTFPHLSNPEVLATSDVASTVMVVLSYFVAGAGLMLLGLLTGSFAASVAMHCANNLFVSVVVRPEVSALSTQTIFIDHSTQNVELINLVAVVVLYGVTILAVLVFNKCRNKKQNSA